MNTTKRLTGSFTASNRKAGTLGPAYVAKDGNTIPRLELTDHDLTGASGLLRVYGAADIVEECIIRKIRLLNGQYSPGVIAGIMHVAGGTVNNLTMEDIEYERAEGITSAGDIYAGIIACGGHAKGSSIAYGSGKNYTFRNIRGKNAYTNYTGTSVGKYENSDFFVFENTFSDILLDNVDCDGAADAGLDRKSPNTVCQKTRFGHCRMSFKTWTDAHDVDVYSLFPRECHWRIAGKVGSAKVVQQVCDFAQLRGADPNIEVVNFQRAPGVLRLLASDLTGLPAGQVLATCDSDARGSKVFIGSKEYDINAATVYL